MIPNVELQKMLTAAWQVEIQREAAGARQVRQLRPVGAMTAPRRWARPPAVWLRVLLSVVAPGTALRPGA